MGKDVANSRSSKYKVLLNDTFIFALGSFGSKIITFLLVPIYTNVLSTEQFGTADLVMTCANLLVPIISIVIQDALLRFGLSKECDKKSVLRCAVTVFIFGSLFCFVLLPFMDMYEAISEWKIYLVVIAISTMASNIIFSYAKVKSQNKSFALCSVIQTLILAITNIILLVVFPCGVKGYLIANIAAQVGSLILLAILTHFFSDIKNSTFDRLLLKKMVAYSLPLIANNISWWILNSADRVMVEAYCSASSLGLYSAASKIPALLSIVTTIFSQAWSISAIKEYDSDRSKTFYEEIFSIFSILMFLGGAIVIGIAKPFMHVYVGSAFFSSWTLVPFLVFGAVYYAFSTFFGAIYGALKKNLKVALSTGFAAAINIAINFIFLEQFGVVVAAISTAVGYFAIGIYRMIDSQKLFAFNIAYSKFGANSAVLLAQTIAVSVDFYVYISSLIAVFLIILINRKELNNLVKVIIRLAGSKVSH
jgi:O-antigen/teichoic acid export membrane protein